MWSEFFDVVRVGVWFPVPKLGRLALEHAGHNSKPSLAGVLGSCKINGAANQLVSAMPMFRASMGGFFSLPGFLQQPDQIG